MKKIYGHVQMLKRLEAKMLLTPTCIIESILLKTITQMFIPYFFILKIRELATEF